MYDLNSNAPCSTEFAVSRFLVPILCQSGWALFTDCDVVFMGNPKELLAIADPDKAVMVVKHNHFGHGTKMGGMTQTHYDRKNWSSVMLINCKHYAWRQITPETVEKLPNSYLHRFEFIDDRFIGALPFEWNWLVGEYPYNEDAKLAHFTLGIPSVEHYKDCDFSDEWRSVCV